MATKKKHVVVLVGPTGIGKTTVGIELAKHLGCEVISADSRQIYRELRIGTATPTGEELAGIPHHLIGARSITDYYNAYLFEQDALALTLDLFSRYNVVILTGGSMMYVDAFCNGIDLLPTVDPKLRTELKQQLEKEGLGSIRRQLKLLDPLFYDQVDLKNPKRVIHALEMCLMTGRPYSEMRTNPKHPRPFNIIKAGLNTEREELYQRINLRVDKMIENGLVEEALKFHPQKHLNAMNTVGYKELFQYLEGDITLERAIELIKRNSRRYAKKQLSWYRRDKEISWFSPDNIKEVIKFVANKMK